MEDLKKEMKDCNRQWNASILAIQSNFQSMQNSLAEIKKDNLNRDITGAIAAGIGANILFISEKKLAKSVITDENRPDYIVHRFVDILDIPILGGVR